MHSNQDKTTKFTNNVWSTVTETATATIEIKKSVFHSFIIPTKNYDESKKEIDNIRKLHRQARHVCTAVILGAYGENAKSNDDGEPAGTAGPIIFEYLKDTQLSDVTAIVVRYFGGVLLGASGLSRAYREATAAAVSNSDLRLREWFIRGYCEVSYQIFPKIESLAYKNNYIIVNRIFEKNIKFEILTVANNTNSINDLIMQTTKGSSQILWSKERELGYKAKV